MPQAYALPGLLFNEPPFDEPAVAKPFEAAECQHKPEMQVLGG